MKKLLAIIALAFAAAPSAFAQFTTNDSPALFTVGTIQQMSNGRTFALMPLAIDGDRLALLNQNWLSWGYGGLVGRELGVADIGDTSFDSMSYGIGGWVSVDFASLGEVQFFAGASAHHIVNKFHPSSTAVGIEIGFRAGVG
jgi:hypothetical protein